jgi:lipopolysaccharide transport system permease protein
MLWRHRSLIHQLVMRELRQRYRGSYLGFAWSLLTPLLTLLVYTFVFSVVFRARWSDGGASTSETDVALTLFAGVIPFSVFSEVANRAPTLVVAVPNYVKKVVFPLEVLPVVAVGTAVVQSLLQVLVLLLGVLVVRGTLSANVLYLPLAYVPLILVCLAAAWFLAALGVFVRDVAQGIGLFTHVLFFATPVFYPVSAVPEHLRGLFLANPLTTVLETFRRTLVWGAPPPWKAWCGWTMGLTACVALGYLWFKRSRPAFADVL